MQRMPPCQYLLHPEQCTKRKESACNLTKYCACHAKGMSWLIHLSYEASVTMRGATGSTSQPHQILPLPRKRNVMIDPSLVWNVIYNARSNRHHLATSPNTAPATQKECHDRSFSRMKRHLQCAGQQASPCKYCACHAKGMSWLILVAIECKYAKAPESWWRRSRTQGVKLCTWAICAHWRIGIPSKKTSRGKGCLLPSLGHESSHGHATRPAPQTQRHPVQPICNLGKGALHTTPQLLLYLTLQSMCSSFAWWWWLSVGLHLGQYLVALLHLLPRWHSLSQACPGQSLHWASGLLPKTFWRTRCGCDHGHDHRYSHANHSARYGSRCGCCSRCGRRQRCGCRHSCGCCGRCRRCRCCGGCCSGSICQAKLHAAGFRDALDARTRNLSMTFGMNYTSTSIDPK